MATKYYWAAKNLDVEVDREEYENREDVVLIPEVPEIINLEPIDKDPEFIPSANVYAGLIGNAPSEIGTRACPAAEDAAEVCCPFLVIKKEDEEPEPPTPVTTYTVTFDSDGGSEVAAQEVEEGETATEPEAPTKDGYTFGEWQLDGQAYDFSTAVTADITLTATWTEL